MASVEDYLKNQIFALEEKLAMMQLKNEKLVKELGALPVALPTPVFIAVSNHPERFQFEVSVRVNTECLHEDKSRDMIAFLAKEILAGLKSKGVV